MNRLHYRIAYVAFGVLAFAAGGVSGVGSGLNQSVCLSMGMVLGLALLPPEMLIEVIQTRLLDRNPNQKRINEANNDD